jgi:hypothetical protein
LGAKIEFFFGGLMMEITTIDRTTKTFQAKIKKILNNDQNIFS